MSYMAIFWSQVVVAQLNILKWKWAFTKGIGMVLASGTTSVNESNITLSELSPSYFSALLYVDLIWAVFFSLWW